MNEPMAAMPGAVLDKSAGTMLREAREAVGLHVGALAVSLKVPVKKLEALEADDLDQLPDAVFARALAATVCRTLKVDPGPVLARLPQLHTPRLKVGSQETPVRLDNRAAAFRVPGLGGLPRPVVYLTGLLLVGALIVGMLPSWRIGGDATTADAAAGMTTGTVVSSSTLSVDAPATTLPTASIDTAPASAPSASALAPGASLAPQVATASATSAGAAATSGAADTAAIVVFTAREASWVQVTDAAGVIHIRRTLAAGETAQIGGSLPLSVVIGRANAIGVVVRGKSFDLASVSKDNVARFQVK